MAADFIFTGVHDSITCRNMLSFLTTMTHAHLPPDMREMPYITVIMKSINDVTKLYYKRIEEATPGSSKSQRVTKLKNIKIKIRNIIRYQLLRNYIHVLRKFGPMLEFNQNAVNNSVILRTYLSQTERNAKLAGKRKKNPYEGDVDISLGDTAFMIQTYPSWFKSNYKEHKFTEALESSVDAMTKSDWDDEKLALPNGSTLESVVDSVTTCDNFVYEWHGASVEGKTQYVHCCGQNTRQWQSDSITNHALLSMPLITVLHLFTEAETKFRRVQENTYNQPAKIRLMGYVVNCSKESSEIHRTLNNTIETSFDNDGSVKNPDALKKALENTWRKQKSLTAKMNALVSETAIGACDITVSDPEKFKLPDVPETSDEKKSPVREKNEQEESL